MQFIESFLTPENTTSTIFLAIAVLSLVVMIFAFILEGIFDFFDFTGDGIISVASVAGFLVFFGLTGYGSITLFDADTITAVIAGLIAGVIGGLLGWLLYTTIRKAEHSVSFSSFSVAGKTATVLLRIPGGMEDYGEVTFVVNGEIVNYAALAEEPIKTGEKVVITSVASSKTVIVERLVPKETITDTEEE